MTHQELIEDFFSHSTERYWEIAMLDDKNYIVPHDKICDYVRSLIKVPYDKFLEYLQLNPPEIPIESKDITQCSSFVACEREICKILLQHNNPGFSYDEIGRLLKQKSGSEKEDAYKKYGENQIKTAKQLGLSFEYFGDWYLSILGYVYMSLSPDEQHALLARTLLRDNLYAHIMTDIRYSDVELLSYMECISSESTKARRYGCVEFLVRICTEECDREGVKIFRIAPRRKFQKKNAEWIASHYDSYEPIAISYNEKLPINVARRAHIYISKKLTARERYLALISAVPTLKDNEEKVLLTNGLNGNKAAFDAVIESYMPLVYNMAEQFHSLYPHIDIQDFIGEGACALISECVKYEERYGKQLIGYAMWSVKKRMASYVMEEGNFIHVPINLLVINERVVRFVEKLQYGEALSLEDLSERLDIPIDTLYECTRANNIKIEPLDVCDNVYLLESPFSADKGLWRDSLSADIECALAMLSPREADILRKSFGINTKEKNLEEIGEQLNLTRERVRQVKEKAIEKIRHSKISITLQTYLGDRCNLYEIDKYSKLESQVITHDESLEKSSPQNNIEEKQKIKLDKKHKKAEQDKREIDDKIIVLVEHKLNERDLPVEKTKRTNHIYRLISDSRKIIKLLYDWVSLKKKVPSLGHIQIGKDRSVIAYLDKSLTILEKESIVTDKTLNKLRTDISFLREQSVEI